MMNPDTTCNSRAALHGKALSLALKASAPVLFAHLPFGLAFGFLFEQLAYPWYWATLMSILCLGGSAQMLALSMMLQRESLPEIWITAAFINSRHIFYGLSLLKRFPSSFLKKFYLIFGLTDETYSLLTITPDQGKDLDLPFCYYFTAVGHFYWVAASTIGALIGAAVTFDIPGIEFVMPALFLCLTIEQARVIKRMMPFNVAIACGILAGWLFPEQMLFVSIAATALVLASIHNWGGKWR